MRELKQRFTQWYNKRTQRKGPLWQDRFKSVYEDGREREDEDGKVVKRGFAAEASDEVEARKGALARSVLVRARVRYFSDGVALGSKAFLEELFRERKEGFGVKRLEGARKMKDVNWGGLMNLRDLRGEV